VKWITVVAIGAAPWRVAPGPDAATAPTDARNTMPVRMPIATD